MKDYIKSTVLWLARLIGAILFSVIFILVSTVITRMATPSAKTELIVQVILGIIGASAMLCYLAHGVGYGGKEKLRAVMVMFLTAVAVHLLFSVLFDFSILISGCAGNLANLFINGGEARLGITDYTIGAGIASVLICDAFFIPSVAAGFVLGKRKRAHDKNELTHE